jgi:hypothetical protein
VFLYNTNSNEMRWHVKISTLVVCSSWIPHYMIITMNCDDEKEDQSQNTTMMRWCPFIKQTTCFGPCTGPSSGLNLRGWGVYIVRVYSQKSGSYKVNEISLLWVTVTFVKPITSAKQCTTNKNCLALVISFTNMTVTQSNELSLNLYEPLFWE